MKKIVAALLATLVLLLAGPAGAHGGEAELRDVTMEQRGDGQLSVSVRLVYVEDGHGVPDATVTVVAEGGTPVTLEPGGEDGVYAGLLVAPAGTPLRITSVAPAVTLETEAPFPPPTSLPPESETTTTAAATTTTTTTAPATTAPAADGDDDEGISPLAIGGIVAVLGAAGVLAAVLLWRTKGDGGDGEPPASTVGGNGSDV